PRSWAAGCQTWGEAWRTACRRPHAACSRTGRRRCGRGCWQRRTPPRTLGSRRRRASWRAGWTGSSRRSTGAGASWSRRGRPEQGLDRRWGELEQGALREARHACELGRRAAQQGDRLLHGEEETAAALREVALVRRAHEGRLDELGRRAEDAERQLASLGEAAVAQREASAGLREQLREQLREELGAAARETSLLGDALGAERAKAAALEERLEAHLGAVEAQLRAELQERHLRLQRSVSRQLDDMSRAMTVGGCEDSWQRAGLRFVGQASACDRNSRALICSEARDARNMQASGAGAGAGTSQQ
ncbi:unnamed protein product, partial [Prorocentrum cordatum]